MIIISRSDNIRFPPRAMRERTPWEAVVTAIKYVTSHKTGVLRRRLDAGVPN